MVRLTQFQTSRCPQLVTKLVEMSLVPVAAERNTSNVMVASVNVPSRAPLCSVRSQMKSSEGGLPVCGVRLGAVRAPVYENKDRDDLLLMAFDEGSVGACVTTANQFYCSSRASLESAFGIDFSCSLLATERRERERGHSGTGMDACRQTIASLAAYTGTSVETVWPFSTGVIGEPLPVQAICDAIPKAYDTCDSSVAAWERASRAIMTTDTRPKLRHIRCEIGGQTVTLTGMAKGSGMIHPNMATMFGLVASDVAMTAECYKHCLDMQ